MSDTIRVQPAARLRQEFARWATAQEPKIRTTALNVFAVSAGIFAHAPEEILIGALVDGVRYVPVEEDARERQAGDPAPQFLEGVPGEALPEVPASAYGPGSVPLSPPDFAPLEDVPADEQGPASDDPVWPEGITPPSPDLVQAAMDATLTAVEVRAASGPSGEDATAAGHVCADCGNPYATERGLATHRRQKHAEGA